jgi:6-phosphogluconolactonase/glucosamine-6-phosphate isomerase/deaminase
LSIPTLRDARELLVLVTGADKADAVRRAFGEAPSPRTPASLARSAHGPTTVVLDRAAAAALPS